MYLATQANNWLVAEQAPQLRLRNSALPESSFLFIISFIPNAHALDLLGISFETSRWDCQSELSTKPLSHDDIGKTGRRCEVTAALTDRISNRHASRNGC